MVLLSREVYKPPLDKTPHVFVHLADVPVDEVETLFDEVVDLEEVGRDQDVHYALHLEWLHLTNIEVCNQQDFWIEE